MTQADRDVNLWDVSRAGDGHSTYQGCQCVGCVQGWRWSFYISGIPGVVLGLLIMLTVREPPRRTVRKSSDSSDGMQPIQDMAQMTACQKLACTLKPFMSFSIILLCLGGSIRNAGKTEFFFFSLCVIWKPWYAVSALPRKRWVQVTFQGKLVSTTAAQCVLKKMKGLQGWKISSLKKWKQKKKQMVGL